MQPREVDFDMAKFLQKIIRQKSLWTRANPVKAEIHMKNVRSRILNGVGTASDHRLNSVSLALFHMVATVKRTHSLAALFLRCKNRAGFLFNRHFLQNCRTDARRDDVIGRNKEIHPVLTATSLPAPAPRVMASSFDVVGAVSH